MDPTRPDDGTEWAAALAAARRALEDDAQALAARMALVADSRTPRERRYPATQPEEVPMQLDPRIAFYLEHRDMIEDLCRARSEVSPAANRMLTAVARAAEAQAGELDGRPVTHLELDCEYPKALYYLPEWRAPGTSPARVAVGLEWVRHNVTFETAYAGVWVDCRHPEGSVLSARLERAFCEDPMTAPFVRANQWFPAQRVLRSKNPRYWADLDGLSDELLATLADAWHTFHPIILRVLLVG